MTDEVTTDDQKPKCNLCLKNDADQTGSHITSAFLLASQIGERGEEKSHIITTNPDQDYSENSGDSQVKEDFILCRDCEKRLSFIENIYSSEITNKIEEERFAANFPFSSIGEINFVSCNLMNPIAFHLLVYSILWRASISSNLVYQNLKFDETTEEDLRFTIDLFLPNVVDHKIIQSVDEWKKMVSNCQDLFNYFPYYILKADSLEEKTQTYEFFDNVSTNPYQIIINEYIILPFFNQLSHSDDFLQVKRFTNPTILNNNYSTPKIIIIPNDDYLVVIKMIQTLAVEQRIKSIEQECVVELISQGKTIEPELLKKMINDRVNSIKLK